VHQLVTTLHERFPNKRFYMAGFSLGGNVSLKFLGELGSTAESRGIYGAAVTCVPFDLTQSQKKLDVGFNRAVYSMVRLATHSLLFAPTCPALPVQHLRLMATRTLSQRIARNFPNM